MCSFERKRLGKPQARPSRLLKNNNFNFLKCLCLLGHFHMRTGHHSSIVNHCQLLRQAKWRPVRSNTPQGTTHRSWLHTMDYKENKRARYRKGGGAALDEAKCKGKENILAGWRFFSHPESTLGICCKTYQRHEWSLQSAADCDRGLSLTWTREWRTENPGGPLGAPPRDLGSSLFQWHFLLIRGKMTST